MKRSTLMVVAAASLIAVSLRLVNLPFMNFSAVAALAVLCGSVVRPVWLGLLIPLGCRALTDCVLEYRTGHGFYGSMMFDYLAYVTIFAIGRTLQPRQWAAAAGTGLLAALTFFLISNFGVWCMPHEGQYMFPQTMSGLWNCYVMGVPFAKGTFLGDVCFTLAFVGSLQVLSLTATRPVTGTELEEVK
jgi:hypothetical protein